MTDISIISKTIKRLREESNFTQGQIAQYLNMDQSLFSRIESGSRNISVDNLEKLGDLFGVRIEDFSKEQLDSPKLNISFRSSSLTSEDLSTIAKINKIAMNLNMMHELLMDDNDE